MTWKGEVEIGSLNFVCSDTSMFLLYSLIQMQIMHSLFCKALQVILKPLLISIAEIHFQIKDLRREKRPQNTPI